MFETKILETKLAGTMADCMFRRINGCAYEGDVSFISTLRALLMHVDMGEHSLSFESASLPIDSFMSEEQCVSALSNHIQPDKIVYLSIEVPATMDPEAAKSAFFAHAASDNIHEFMDVREFFASKMACRAMICEETRSTLIVVLASNIKKHHLAQCIMPKLLPWYFTPLHLSATERSLLAALTSRYSENYVRIMESIADSDWFRQRETAAAMSAFKRRNMERQQSTVEQSIRDHESRIDTLNADLIQELRMVADQNLKLNGIMLALASDTVDDDGLTDFLAANPDVQIMSMDNDRLKILVNSYLDVYDPDAYASMARNPNSWYWSNTSAPSGPFVSRENRKKVLDAIFSDSPVFKIRSFGVYTMNCSDGTTSGTGGRYGERIPDDRYANPHLHYASCLGSYRSTINRAVLRGDMVGAISQCIASAHSVNVTESATFRHLCRDIFINDQPILEGPNGMLCNALQAYQYLCEHSNEGE